jgi:hypothetical protein
VVNLITSLSIKVVLMLNFSSVSKRIAYFVLLIAFASDPRTSIYAQLSDAAPTIWSDVSGKYRVEATFVRIEKDTVYLRRKVDGQEIPVLLSKLSPESQQRAIASQKAQSASSKSTPAPASNSPMASNTSSIAIPAGLDAKAFADFVVEKLQAGQSIVLWDMLPSQYQNDAQEIVNLAVGKLDEKSLQPLKMVRNDVLKVLRAKEDFILNNAMLLPLLGESEAIKQAYGPMVDVLEAYLSDDLLSIKNWKSRSLRENVLAYTSNLTSKIERVQAAVPEGTSAVQSMQAANLKNLKYEILNATPTTATIKLELPGRPATELELISIEDRWLPRNWVETWESQVSKAKASLEQITPQKMKEQIAQAQMPLMMVQGVTQQMLAANDQASFDQVITGILSMFGLGSGLPDLSEAFPEAPAP